VILLDENPIFYLGDIEMRHIKMVSHELPGRAAGPASILIMVRGDMVQLIAKLMRTWMMMLVSASQVLLA